MLTFNMLVIYPGIWCVCVGKDFFLNIFFFICISYFFFLLEHCVRYIYLYVKIFCTIFYFRYSVNFFT